LTGLIVLIVLLGVIVFLIDKSDRQKAKIKQLEMEKQWDYFSYQLLETQLLVHDAIDQCNQIRSMSNAT
jgi:hypothetical protein